MFSEAQQDMTLLSVVRTDQSQISSILASTFVEAEMKDAPLDSNHDQIRNAYKQYFDQCKQFLFGQINHERAVEELQKAQGGSRGVCAKTLSVGNVAWKCETCEKDPTCIICQECFEAGDHKGHKVWLKRNVSGCCDCGDPDAWQEEGFCSKHKGYSASSEALLEQLPAFIKRSAKYVFAQVCYELKVKCMELQAATLQGSYKGAKSADQKRRLTKSAFIINMLFDFIGWCVEVTPAFIHFLTDCLEEPFLEGIRILDQSTHGGLGLQAKDKDGNSLHQCCPRSFISAEDRSQLSAKIQKLLVEEDGHESVYLNQASPTQTFSEETLVQIRNEKNLCTCNVLDLTFQVNHILSEKCRETQYELYFKMFQSFKFKQLLGLSFAANFQSVCMRTDKMKNSIGSIGVQLLTIDDIALMIQQDPNLRGCLLQGFTKCMDSLAEEGFGVTTKNEQNALFHIVYDFKYMARTKTLKYVIENTTFIESILEQLARLYYQDLIEFRTEHIMFDHSIFKEGLYNIDIMITKILKAYLKNIDPTDVPRNKRMMSAFIALFKEVADKMPPAEAKVGFFAITLHRIFSYYFTRLILQNFMRENTIGKKPKDVFLDIFRRFVEIPTGQNAWRYLQSVVDTIMGPLARSWSFTHEILSGKWVMSGMFINHLPKLLYSVYEYYLLLSLGLIQMLVVVSPDPRATVEGLIGAFIRDSWMKTLHEKLAAQQIVTLKDFECYKPMFDEKKLRQMLHWELRLLTQIVVSEAAYLYPLLTNLTNKAELTFPQHQKCTEAIEATFKEHLKRSIVHALILSGGRADFKQIKENLGSQEAYLNSEYFEEMLLAVTTQQRDTAGGKVYFKLKEDPYLAWFEPYCYLQPESQAKVHEVFQGVYADKKFANEVIGDYQGAYKYGVPVNKVIREALAHSSDLFRYLAGIICIWQSQTTFKLFDEQIGFESLRLMLIIAEEMPKIDKGLHTATFLATIKANDWELVKSLKSKSQPSGPVLEKSIKEVLKAFYDADHHELQYIGEMLGLTTQDEDQELPSQEAQEQLSLQSARSQAESKKELMKKRQEDILKKFQDKRLGYMKSQQSAETPPLLRSSSSFKETGEDEGEIECSLCKETLDSDHFYGNPYGQFAYVSNSKLLYHAYRQTLSDTSRSLSVKSESPQEQEEEKKASEMSMMDLVQEEADHIDPLERLDVNSLDVVQGTGGTLTKCSHYAHSKCLTSYLTANESDIRKRDIRKLIGFDFQTFQCPLCKHIANVLLPCHTLTSYQEQKLLQEDFNPYDLLEFHVRLLSKIVMKQECRKKKLLPVDIRKSPLEILVGVERFVEHRIELLSVKGLEQFLMKGTSQQAHNRVGKDQYADIVEITRNVLSLVLEGGISVPQTTGVEDLEMTEETLEGLCLGEIQKVLSSRRGWRLMESNFTSVAIQLMYYTFMLYGSEDIPRLDYALNAIATSVYQLHRLQTLIRALYAKQQVESAQSRDPNILTGKPHELFNMLSNYESLLAMGGFQESQSADQAFVDQFVTPLQLGFLRKVAAFKVLVHTINCRTAQIRASSRVSTPVQSQMDEEEQILSDSKDLRKYDETFVKSLNSMVDDNEEFNLLSTYLSLNNNHEEASCFLPDELQDVLNFFTSVDQQKQSLESYALSTLIQLLNPDLLINEVDKPILKDQILDSSIPELLHLPMPAALQVLSGLRFRLQQLPTDLQSLVQTYYKRLCRNCKTQPKECCVCLLCGDVVCFLQKCCSGNLPGMKAGEGELSFHTRTCEGGQCLFLCTTNGKVIMIEEERSCQRPSPYINKFGETFSSSSKKWESYQIPSAMPGQGFYEEYKKMYMNFSIANEVIKDRSMAEVLWRMRVI